MCCRVLTLCLFLCVRVRACTYLHLCMQLFQCPSTPISLHKRWVWGCERFYVSSVYFFASVAIERVAVEFKLFGDCLFHRELGPRKPFEVFAKPFHHYLVRRNKRVFTHVLRHVACVSELRLLGNIFVNNVDTCNTFISK